MNLYWGIIRSNLFRPTIMLGLVLMLGRIAGLFRELVLANTLGVSAQADIAILLLTLPDLLTGLLLSGGLSVALVPAMRRAGSAAPLLFKQASFLIAVFFIFIAAMFVIAPAFWIGLLAPGINLTALNLPFITFVVIAFAFPLTALSGVSAAVLNTYHRFFVAGCGTLIFNISVVIALLIASTSANGLEFLCFGIFLGALIRWLSQLLLVPKVFEDLPALSSKQSFIEPTILKDYLHGMLASFALLMVPVIVRSVASTFGEGHLSAFNYATKLVELPVATLITTIATVAYPQFCKDHLEANNHRFHKSFQLNLNKIWVISLIVLFCGWPLSGMAVKLLFGNGKISTEMLITISELTQIALLSVPFVGINSLLISVLNSKGHSKLVVKSSLASLLILLVFMKLGVFFKSSNFSMLGLSGFNIGLIVFLLIGNKDLRSMINWMLLLKTMMAVIVGSIPIWIWFELINKKIGMSLDFNLIGLSVFSCLLAITLATLVINKSEK